MILSKKSSSTLLQIKPIKPITLITPISIISVIYQISMSENIFLNTRRNRKYSMHQSILQNLDYNNKLSHSAPINTIITKQPNDLYNTITPPKLELQQPQPQPQPQPNINNQNIPSIEKECLITIKPIINKKIYIIDVVKFNLIVNNLKILSSINPNDKLGLNDKDGLFTIDRSSVFQGLFRYISKFNRENTIRALEIFINDIYEEYIKLEIKNVNENENEPELQQYNELTKLFELTIPGLENLKNTYYDEKSIENKIHILIEKLKNNNEQNNHPNN
jgi:hypothetical protein